jgi:hypothetical protein
MMRSRIAAVEPEQSQKSGAEQIENAVSNPCSRTQTTRHTRSVISFPTVDFACASD